jgi:DNA-binding HxlR family transcriptional regulator
MTTRSYKQYCGLARALDLVGERWALLVVRELLFGPKRYSDLLSRLPGISTNILAARLQELEDAGVLTRKTLAPPAASTVYELTDEGRALEEPILALGRWGGKTLGPRTRDRSFLPAWGLLALRASFKPERSTGLRGTFEFRIEDEVFHVRVKGRNAALEEGGATRPDVVVETDSDTFLELGLGTLPPEAAIKDGRVKVEGDSDRLTPFFGAFRFPAAEGMATANLA